MAAETSAMREFSEDELREIGRRWAARLQDEADRRARR